MSLSNITYTKCMSDIFLLFKKDGGDVMSFWEWLAYWLK